MKKKGNPGYNSMVLAGKVRDLALTQILEVLQGNDEEYKKALLLKISTSLLPRLNEHSGPNGGDIPIPLLHVLHNTGDKKDIQPQKEN